MKRFLYTLLLVALSHSLCAQLPRAQMGRLTQYFDNYSTPLVNNSIKTTIEDLQIDSEAKVVHLYVSEAFVFQPFTPTVVKKIYEEVKPLLPAPYNTYQLIIYAQGTAIEQLIPAHLMGKSDTARTYQRNVPRVNAWVTPLNRPNRITHGLLGRHLCIWQSHGKYFSESKKKWEWQRPYLFATNEDVFTQTFLVPYLFPMLERAGAIVFTPRERDWQKDEKIVDNDFTDKTSNGYNETSGKYEWKDAGTGFAWVKDVYQSGENPFEHGTCRSVEAQSKKHQLSSIRWQPTFASEGDYAVYVSYKTLPTSVSDATYTVHHEGVSTSFRVNQQMGGSTWVYLGTFHFKAGSSAENCVTLTNHSNYRGTITADAVRFGGGMGNIARGEDYGVTPTTSGMPRAIESARYNAQWYGFHDSIYHSRGDDYSDDIIVRPAVLNQLARGSFYNPGDSGRCVPIELSMGVHSDAGYRPDSSLIGTLGIYTSFPNDGRTIAGLSRLTSRDLTDMVMTQITSDLTNRFGTWNRRAMYDRNYGETREPVVPSMILEMLSHQNWADMRMGHDPYFKFTLARAVYKGILQYLSYVHGADDPVTQPLPVTQFAAQLQQNKDAVNLYWGEPIDDLDETARPTHYILYTAVGDRGFDNGQMLTGNECEVDIEPGLLYRFRIAAANEGGSSALSEEICAYKSPTQAHNLLIVDAFQRVAGPFAFDNDSTGGFDMDIDGGVPDVRTMGYTGRQTNFNKADYGKSAELSFGYCTAELEGMLLAGNTHNYSTLHAQDILATGQPVNISSCTSAALPALTLAGYRIVDVALGAQKDDGYSLRPYKTFTPGLCSALEKYTQQGGSLLVSGAYIGSDMMSGEERDFLANTLKCQFATTVCTDSIGTINGMGLMAELYRQPNEQHYWVRHTDVLVPQDDAFCAMIYGLPKFSAAVASASQTHRVMTFGFPLECITDASTRRSVFAASIQFLLQ